MMRSIYTFGKSVVRRILPFGTLDVEDDLVIDPDIISVGEFLETFKRLALGNPAAVDYENLTVAIQTASEEWFGLLLGTKGGLLILLNADSAQSQRFLSELVFNNTRFLDAVLANSPTSAQQFAAGIRESATIRRHVYLLLIALGMHSYDGHVLIYKTVNLLQRELPNGMFQYMSEEIAEVTQMDGAPAEANLEALVPPLALLVILFAGGNGFFIENHLRQQIRTSKLLTTLVDVVKSKFVEEKHNRRLELPTLKEPASRECTPQINRAIEILEQAERSSDRILLWLEKFANNTDELFVSPNAMQKSLHTSAPMEKSAHAPAREYTVTLQSTKPVQEYTVKEQSPKPLVGDVSVVPPISPARPEVLQAPPILPAVNTVGAVQPENSSEDLNKVSGASDIEPVEKRRPVAEVRPVGSVPNGIPAPPPPPPPPLMNEHGQQVAGNVARSQLKPLRWVKLDASEDVVSKTIWEPKKDVCQVDLAKLEELFKNERLNEKFAKGKNHIGVSLQEAASNPTDFISAQTELRINVILKQFPDIDVEQIAEHIQKCDLNAFDESQLRELIAALPSDQEFLNIAKLKREDLPLKPAERFLFCLLDVDNLKLRLETMSFVMEFPVTERSVRRNCDDVIKACRIIQSSESYRNFLQVVLKVGNKMNEGRAIGDAVAFDTMILPKLAETPNSSTGTSLLHFLVDQLNESNPSALKFVEELEPVLETARVPLVQMKTELLSAREKYAQLLEEVQEVGDSVQSELEIKLQGFKQRLNSLTNIVVAAQQRMRNLAMYLMEDPGTFQITKYIEMISSFLQSVRHITAAPVRHGSVSEHSGTPVRHDSVSGHSGDRAAPPSYASPLMNDPKMASVFLSLRNELQSTVLTNHSEG